VTPARAARWGLTQRDPGPAHHGRLGFRSVTRSVELILRYSNTSRPTEGFGPCASGTSLWHGAPAAREDEVCEATSRRRLPSAVALAGIAIAGRRLWCARAGGTCWAWTGIPPLVSWRRSKHWRRSSGTSPTTCSERGLRSTPSAPTPTLSTGLGSPPTRSSRTSARSPGRLQKLYISYGEASDALTAYWFKLQAARNKADTALRQGQEAEADLARATGHANTAAADLKSAQAGTDPKTTADAQSAHDAFPHDRECRSSDRTTTVTARRVTSVRDGPTGPNIPALRRVAESGHARHTDQSDTDWRVVRAGTRKAASNHDAGPAEPKRELWRSSVVSPSPYAARSAESEHGTLSTLGAAHG
jgi:hypothetical protein